ncbi:histidine kinase, partial [Pseudomonas aeruginosa]
LILLILALYFSLRLGRQISTPLLQLRVWLRDPDNPAPGAGGFSGTRRSSRSRARSPSSFCSSAPEPEE